MDPTIQRTGARKPQRRGSRRPTDRDSTSKNRNREPWDWDGQRSTPPTQTDVRAPAGRRWRCPGVTAAACPVATAATSVPWPAGRRRDVPVAAGLARQPGRQVQSEQQPAEVTPTPSRDSRIRRIRSQKQSGMGGGSVLPTLAPMHLLSLFFSLAAVQFLDAVLDHGRSS